MSYLLKTTPNASGRFKPTNRFCKGSDTSPCVYSLAAANTIIQQLELLLKYEPPLNSAVTQGQKDNVTLTMTAPGNEAESPVALVADRLAEPAGMPVPPPAIFPATTAPR